MFTIKAFKRSMMIAALGTLVAVQTTGPAVAASPPSVRITEGVEITPDAAYTAFGSATAHSSGWDGGFHPELGELADALNNDTNLIYQYVRYTVETLPMWGLKKGAMGAHLDKKGTAWDQAALMVALINKGVGSTASFHVIKSSMSFSEFNTVYGVSSAADIAALLKAGGIPFVISGSTVDFMHVVVGAGGTYYDPALKPQTKLAGMTLDSSVITGYSNTALATAANLQGTTTISQAAAGYSALQTQLNDYAGSLAESLKSETHYEKSTRDVVGGFEIEAMQASDIGAVQGAASLAAVPHYSATYHGGMTAVPDQYRTKITFSYYDTVAVAETDLYTAYFDEIYGRHIWLEHFPAPSGNFIAQLRIGKNLVASYIAENPNVGGYAHGGFFIDIDHPNGTAFDHREEFNPVQLMGDAAGVVLGSGYTGLALLGRQLDANYQTLAVDPTASSNALTFSEDVGRTLTGIGSSYLSQQSQLAMMVDGITDSRTLLHDVIGLVAGNVVGGEISPYMDIRSQVSVVKTSSARDRKAAINTLSFAMSALEGAITDQVADDAGAETGSATTISMMAKVLKDGGSIYDIAAGGYATSGAVLTGYDAETLDRITNATTGYNLTHRVLLPSQAGALVGDFSGAGYLAVNSDFSQVAHLLDDDIYSQDIALKGAGSVKIDPAEGAAGLNSTLFMLAGNDPSVHVSAAGVSVNRTSLVTGSGSFPYALPFALSYAPVSAAGGGWSHNYDMEARFGANGMLALGQRSPTEAARAIVAIKGAYDRLSACTDTTGCTTGQDLVLTALVMNWMQAALRDNVFIVRSGHSSTAFSKLPDGSYFSPDQITTLSMAGSGATATATLGSIKSGVKTVFTVTAADARDYEITRVEMPGGQQANFTHAADTLTVDNGTIGRSITILEGDGSSYLVRATDENGYSTEVDDVTAAYSAQIDKDAFVIKISDGVTNADLGFYELDTEGRIAEISTPEVTNKTTVSYNLLGQATSRLVKDRGTFTSKLGGGWRSESAGPGDAASVAYGDPYGRTSFAVNAEGQMGWASYDRLGRVLESHDATGGYTTSSYDYRHNRVTVTRYSAEITAGVRESLATSFTYHGADKYYQLATVSDPAGQLTSIEYYDSTTPTKQGLVKTQTLPATDIYGSTSASAVITFDYTAAGLLDTVSDPDGVVSKNTYLANGALESVIADYVPGSTNTSQNLTTTYGYSPQGDITSVTDSRLNVSSISYDTLYRRAKTTTGPEGGFAETFYDLDGRVTSSDVLVNAGTLAKISASRTYDSVGRVLTATDAAGNVTTISYDDVGRFVEVTDARGVKSRRYFDKVGRTVSSVSNVGGGADEITETLSYTPEGRLAWVEDGRSTRTSYSYDHFSRQIETSYFAGDTETVTGFDSMGRPDTYTTRGGDTVSLVWDELGRVKSRTVAGTTYTTRYDIRGQVREIVRTGGLEPDGLTPLPTDTVSYTYDRLGRITAETSTGGTVGYAYDDAAGSYDLDYNGAYGVRYATDGLGRITTISELTGGASVASYSYDVASRIQEITYGNGAVQTFAHDDAKGWLDSVSLDPEGTSDDGAEVTSKDVSFSYSRDALGRIEGEDISNANYVWRPARLASDGSTAYATNAINQYTSVGTVSPTYDTAGNLTSDGTYTYTYDSQNLLKEVKKTINSVDVDVASYSYDALNRRSEKAVVAGAVTTRYLWGGVTNYAEMDGGGVVQRYFIYGGGIDTPVMVREYDGSKSYVHQSGKSSVFATTTDGGAAVAAAGTTAYTMDPWGEGTDASGSPFKFTARRIDDETGNYYYRNRYYHAGQGRFMSNDPIGYADGLNMYAYVGNDPVNYRDPMGLSGEEAPSTSDDDSEGGITNIYIRCPDAGPAICGLDISPVDAGDLGGYLGGITGTSIFDFGLCSAGDWQCTQSEGYAIYWRNKAPEKNPDGATRFDHEIVVTGTTSNTEFANSLGYLGYVFNAQEAATQWALIRNGARESARAIASQFFAIKGAGLDVIKGMHNFSVGEWSGTRAVTQTTTTIYVTAQAAVIGAEVCAPGGPWLAGGCGLLAGAGAATGVDELFSQFWDDLTWQLWCRHTQC